MISPVDANVVGAIVAGMAGAIWLAGWLGWTLRAQRAASEHARFVQDLQPTRTGGALFHPDEVGDAVRPWWDAGYARGYRDGKKNRRRADSVRAVIIAKAPQDAVWGGLLR